MLLYALINVLEQWLHVSEPFKPPKRNAGGCELSSPNDEAGSPNNMNDWTQICWTLQASPSGANAAQD
jgi:hypothetical protein